ncbi:SDR family oxidoreductase [Bacillus sp. JJ1773]|uniref:SDR family NAD(P)-dependent oxidoreductase n=1 Tax=Bacillus sp. JJ1773 TaxID=3122965 RepID=UPI0030005CC4
MRLQDKTAIITGAGNGIGRETAYLFAREGANVVVTDICEEAASNTTEEIKKHGGKSIHIPHNISIESDWENVIAKTLDNFGKINILFNNAGTFLIKPLIDTTLEEWHQLMNINLAGTFLGLKHVIPVMMKQNGGSIINNSSTAGLMGSVGVSLYGASKGAIRILTKHVAMEYAPYNIRANTIFPGFVDTDMMKYRGEVDQSNKQQQSQGVPLGRIGNSDEVAKTVLFLASDDSSYTTGAEFVIDGGRSAGRSPMKSDHYE